MESKSVNLILANSREFLLKSTQSLSNSREFLLKSIMCLLQSTECRGWSGLGRVSVQFELISAAGSKATWSGAAQRQPQP
eukprot:2152272-Rhodomonas_salina.1